MATKVSIPGSGQTVDLSSPGDALRSFLMASVAFGLAAAAGAIGVKMYNVVANNTPDAVQTVDVI